MNSSPPHWSEIAKNLVQVVAWVLAGAWTLWIFRQTQYPFLEARGTAESSARWIPLSSDKRNCQANFEVRAGNAGNVAFDVASVRVRVWRYSKPEVGAELSFLDVADIQNAPPQFDHEINTSTLVRHYAPGQAGMDTFVWLIPQQANTRTLFRADFRTKHDSELLPSTYYWDETCGVPDTEGVPQKGELTAADQANIGSSYLLQGRYDEAEAEFTRALKADPNLLVAYFNRAVTYNSLGGNFAKSGQFARARQAYDNAISDYDHALRINPKYTRGTKEQEGGLEGEGIVAHTLRTPLCAFPPSQRSSPVGIGECSDTKLPTGRRWAKCRVPHPKRAFFAS